MSNEQIGIVYLLTNKCYEKENTYKYGITKNYVERRRIQKNSVPPTNPFYNKIMMFSTDYKLIEKYIENRFKENNVILNGNGGTEWIQSDFVLILSIFEEALKMFPKTEMCYNGKRYKYVDGAIKQYKLPNCNLNLLGIKNGYTVKCIKDNKEFKVYNNKINVNGEKLTLSQYMNIYHSRNGITNEHNGYQYFSYKGMLIYDLWQSLVGCTK